MFQMICPPSGNTQYIQNTWKDKEQHKVQQKQTNTCYINDNIMDIMLLKQILKLYEACPGKYPVISNISRTGSVALM